MRDQGGQVHRHIVRMIFVHCGKDVLTDLLRMGLTPLAGLPGATRSGDIDPS